MTLLRDEKVGASALELTRAKGPIRGRIALLGPAFVAAVAYIDPGNFATLTFPPIDEIAAILPWRRARIGTTARIG